MARIEEFGLELLDVRLSQDDPPRIPMHPPVADVATP